MAITKRAIKNLLKKENPIILELGAHKGVDTIEFLKEFKDVRIYCFEPDPRCISGFKDCVKDDRCALIEAAVSNEDGKATLNISGGWRMNIPGMIKVLGLTRYYVSSVLICRRMLGKQEEWDMSSSIKKSISYPEDWPWITFNKTAEVKTIKLDTFIKESRITFIDFIWVDIQGAERDMIEGGVDALNKTRYLYTEYGETSSYPDAMTREETIDLLQRHNFEIISEYSDKKNIGNALFINRKFISDHQET